MPFPKLPVGLCAKSLSHVQLFATLWTAALQAPLSTGFSRQEYWSELSCPPLGDLPDPRNKPTSLISPELAGRLFTTSTTWEAYMNSIVTTNQKSVIDIQRKKERKKFTQAYQELEEIFLQFARNHKRPNRQTNLEKE